MTRFPSLIAASLLATFSPLPLWAADSVDTSGPGQLIASAAQSMLKELDAHRAEYRKDPAKVEQLVDEVLLQHFDSQYAARLVLGTHS